MDYIALSDGRMVSKKDYIVAKTKDLIAFGYRLKSSETKEQLEKVLNKEDSLNVIGMFIKPDIDIEKSQSELK